MRISGGKLKGRRLVYPRSGIRPTKDIVRQAIFNILGNEVEGARVCDLFAGGGALGIEAVSRGAKEAVFVERSAIVLKCLQENVAELDGTRIIRGDVLRVVPKLRGAGFDIVFADPPYQKGLGQKVVDAVLKYEVLRVGGVLVLEHSVREDFIVPLQGKMERQERYGESVLTFFRRFL
ncbi:16S rRNA (guanine(966)-N(2))-methyltransferase RsmD [candidate division WOR-3 bacterium]|nr:16S rRNA (guanine(966)-N(2))-methyltransferase RsmD [candidate division WOR-3 bacterium]